MKRIAVETKYLEPDALRELNALVGDWARVDVLPPRTDEAGYREMLRGASVVVGAPRSSWVVGTQLNLVQLSGVGYEDYVGVGLEAQEHFVLCNARGVLSICIAEHVMALMLALCRQLPHYFAAQREMKWAPIYDRFRELTGQTLVVVGLGDIGSEVARRACGLGMRVLGVRRNVNLAAPLGVNEVLSVQQLSDALKQADHVVAALPGGKNTRHLLNTQSISQIKPGAFLYNVGRGTAVDETALISALQSGHLSGAGLDVFEHEPLPADSPLWQMPQVIVTPHIAGYSHNCMKRFGRLVLDNVQRYRTGKPLLNRISSDELAATRSDW